MSVYDLILLQPGDRVRRVGATAVWDVVSNPEVGDGFAARVRTGYIGVEVTLTPETCSKWVRVHQRPRPEPGRA